MTKIVARHVAGRRSGGRAFTRGCGFRHAVGLCRVEVAQDVSGEGVHFENNSKWVYEIDIRISGMRLRKSSPENMSGGLLVSRTLAKICPEGTEMESLGCG